MSPYEIAAQMLGCPITSLDISLLRKLSTVEAFIVRCPFPDDFPMLIGLRSRQVVATILSEAGYEPPATSANDAADQLLDTRIAESLETLAAEIRDGRFGVCDDLDAVRLEDAVVEIATMAFDSERYVTTTE